MTSKQAAKSVAAWEAFAERCAMKPDEKSKPKVQFKDKKKQYAKH
jgi:hypothetical protein